MFYSPKITLKNISLFTVFCVIIIQVYLIIIYWNSEQFSDAGAYINIAEECYINNSWYPNKGNIYDSYIWSIGYINFLILQYKILGTIALNPIFNLLFQIGILVNIYKLGKAFFNVRVAYISIILYSVLYSNIFIILPALTELPFLFFILTSFSLCLKPKATNLFISGILLVIANTIRPLAIIFLLIICLFLYKKIHLKKYIFILSSTFLTVLLIGFSIKRNTGYFIYQATTSGYNLIMSANDKANGGVINVFSNPNDLGWIENANHLTYKEKDLIWKEKSIRWIKEHPEKFITLYLKKYLLLWGEDSWSDRYFSKKESLGNILRKQSFDSELLLSDILPRILKSLLYYCVLLTGVVSIIKNQKEILTSKGLLVLLLLLGTSLTCIFPSGFRYHHPFLFIIVLWASFGIDSFLNKKLHNKN